MSNPASFITRFSKEVSQKRLWVYALAALLIAWAQGNLSFMGIGPWDSYTVRIINLCAINAILAMSLNLINGFTGQFSLGHAGFMAVGAYVEALLTMDPSTKNMVFFMVPLVHPLDKISIPFLPALLLAGIITGILSLLVGIPALRLRGDYLAISTLGFAEIIRLILQNVRRVTNGALGLKGIPQHTNLWWTIGLAFLTFVCLKRLLNSTYGRAFMAINQNEIAAEAMGIDLFKHKLLSFFISSFLAGVGGALMAGLLTSIDPVMFKFPLTFQVLLIVVLGGMGSLSGSVLSAAIVTWVMEYLRFVEEPHYLGWITIPGIPGLRMVLFSLALVIVVIWYPRGLMGDREITSEDISRVLKGIYGKIRRLFRPEPDAKHSRKLKG